MKFRKKKEKRFKTCPRCGNKCLQSQNRCEECGLMFSRMEFATNAAAKKQLRHFNRDYIVYTNQLPKDVKKWKLVVYTVFLGLLGGHYYYVGKYWKGLCMSLMFLYWVITTIFNTPINEIENGVMLAYLPVGIYAFAWCVSLVLVISNKFKVPVLAELPKGDEVDAMRADFEKVSAEIKSEAEKLKTNEGDTNFENGEEVNIKEASLSEAQSESETKQPQKKAENKSKKKRKKN